MLDVYELALLFVKSINEGNIEFINNLHELLAKNDRLDILLKAINTINPKFLYSLYYCIITHDTFAVKEVFDKFKKHVNKGFLREYLTSSVDIILTKLDNVNKSIAPKDRGTYISSFNDLMIFTAEELMDNENELVLIFDDIPSKVRILIDKIQKLDKLLNKLVYKIPNNKHIIKLYISNHRLLRFKSL